MLDGLIVKAPWADMLVSGTKTLELRSRSTSKRGRIAILESKTCVVLGTVELVDCILLDEEEYEKRGDQHRSIWNYEQLNKKKLYGWVVKNAVKFKAPVPYIHKSGQIVWVKNVSIS